MNLSERLAEDLKQAMKDRDKIRLSVLRMVRSAVRNKELEHGQAITDDETLAVLQKELKQRRDSLASFEQAQRTDLIEQAHQEIAILNEYLPQQMTEEELSKLAAEIIQEVGASSKADMGKVMGQLMPKVRGRADGKAVQSVVQKLL
ncbi:GatB/YqeY domain-containing protein [Alicyclobacillus sp. SO9]|uniref:GatB/YqeY domain-containing protein n=1 Tax=Alicyclobacillus sp. SO9 TaxID=2665646 RepID=UPI0018E72661|nr:GatB/YqeY domain-containing protein [Alicyclobacillus sp. SO9]QQE77338.1 GatB/YqeY domain-containing protein [Alicyclobacillus sp. SO9]